MSKTYDSFMKVHDRKVDDFLFSAHIPYGKGKNSNQMGFFYKICLAPYLYLNLRVLPKEINSHKINFVRFVFMEIFGLF